MTHIDTDFGIFAWITSLAWGILSWVIDISHQDPHCTSSGVLLIKHGTMMFASGVGGLRGKPVMAFNLQFDSDDEREDYKDKRQVPRCYPVVELPIYDVDDPMVEGLVWDISEKGAQVAGIEARVGQRKTFFIQANDFGSFSPFSFEAECRWVATEEESGQCVCGFEILGISDKDMEELRKVIDLLALSD